MKKVFKIIILGIFLMTLNTVVNAGAPPDPSGGSGCTDISGNCDLPLDNNVIILAVASVVIGTVMLRKKLNTISFQA